MGWMGKSIELLAHALDFRVKRQGVIAANLANIDTPGYRPKDLKFDDVLRRAADQNPISLKRTHPKHIQGAGGYIKRVGRFPLVEQVEGFMGDKELDLDLEMAKMAKNNLLYEATVQMLSKKFEKLKMVIEEGRR